MSGAWPERPGAQHREREDSSGAWPERPGAQHRERENSSGASPDATEAGGRRPASGPLGARVAAFDETAARWAERHHTPARDRFFYGLSSAADHSLLWFTAGAVRAARTGNVRAAVRFGVAMGVESALTNGPIKSLFRRVRPPSHQFHPPGAPLPYGMRRPITSSFPSGHATAAFTAATLLSAGRRGKPLWFGLAALVAVSRVYVRMHHASDVAAGAVLGLGLGQLFRRLLSPDR